MNIQHVPTPPPPPSRMTDLRAEVLPHFEQMVRDGGHLNLGRLEEPRRSTVRRAFQSVAATRGHTVRIYLNAVGEDIVTLIDTKPAEPELTDPNQLNLSEAVL